MQQCDLIKTSRDRDRGGMLQLVLLFFFFDVDECWWALKLIILLLKHNLITLHVKTPFSITIRLIRIIFGHQTHLSTNRHWSTNASQSSSTRRSAIHLTALQIRFVAVTHGTVTKKRSPKCCLRSFLQDCSIWLCNIDVSAWWRKKTSLVVIYIIFHVDKVKNNWLTHRQEDQMDRSWPSKEWREEQTAYDCLANLLKAIDLNRSSGWWRL